ncbi:MULTISPECIES: Clp protease/crotonase-like domain-containing protein [Shewanella]|jgi:hypothetical protein|uniref:Lipoprotein n=1 Tax=Shewanella psychromarinicola TaxID=2487742 RepID=A0A3N4DRV9_9GAMM|nr:hypothetical protein [Shewanella psychromarinicola]AZG37300.1 hypothetical protein EGC80_22150 [Shewanella psychromarinicola]MCL1084395.1 hypothetical protein [Shewanella psychromarinicola]RPA27497.1 hypothetical protein EGC77_17100 [Shewanella psychromarinicola]
MRYLLVALLLALMGCAAQQEPFSVAIDPLLPSTILYNGEITPENVASFEQLITNSPTKIESLIINSGGGDVFAGIRFGELVFEYKLKVVVDKACASSCANYIVTASDDVTVRNGGLLGWHGGALQPIYVPITSNKQRANKMLRKEADDFLTQWQQAEHDFFQMVKVNQAVTILGMVPGLEEKRDAQLFSYDQQTLKQLGLHITYEGEQATTSRFGEYIVQIFSVSPDVLETLLTQHNKILQQH